MFEELEVRHVQTVHVACLHQCAKNVCPAAGLSSGVRTASSSSNRPSHRFKLLDEHRNNSGSKLLDAYHNNRAANLQLADLGKHAVAFALDPQGSRFIQQKLRRANSTETAQLLINEITAQVTPLSLHEHGNWVIRCVLEHCTEQQKRPVLEQLHDNVLSLVTDPYGNYVIQHVIEHGLLEDRDRIAHILKGDIMKYAQDKFASNIIEKCLICGTADQKKALIDNVCGGGPKTLQNARQLMADEFGTHVIQKCFEYGTEGQKAQLVDALRGHVFTLTLQMYGSPVIQTALKSVDKASQIEAKAFNFIFFF
uniref:PUM-HD domain-containing protein n=1 Tax=Globodera pallida TaxID=36090 RepID=A0A183CCA0_GLOPA